MDNVNELLKKAIEYANSEEDVDSTVPLGIDGMDRVALLKILHYITSNSK